MFKRLGTSVAVNSFFIHKTHSIVCSLGSDIYLCSFIRRLATHTGTKKFVRSRRLTDPDKVFQFNNW